MTEINGNSAHSMPSTLDATPKDQSVLSLLREFCGYTTFGGLGRVVSSPYLVFRVIWLLLFLGGLVMGIIQLESLYRKYEQKPVSTKISLHHNQQLSFPSVTVCNHNIIRRTKVDEIPSSVLKAHINEILGDNEKSENEEDESEEQEQEGSEDDEENEEGFEDPEDLAKDYKMHEIIAIALASTSREDIIPLGHEFEELVLSCTYRGVDCRKNFTSGKYWGKFWHYSYGNCFVFNPLIDWSGKTRKRPRKAFRAGPSNGLKLQLNIEQFEYLDRYTQKAGAVIQVSPYGVMPFPGEEGISVPPGFSTSIGMTKVNIKRVDPFKNRSCVDNIANDDKNNLYHIHHNATYSKTACVASCLAYNQMKLCKCMEYRFPTNDDQAVCNTLNKTIVKCLRNLSNKLKNNQLNCSSACPPPCNEEAYKMTSSYAAWPSANYKASLEQELKSESNHSFKTSNGLSDNMLEVRIFYQELNYELIEEKVSYELVNFISDIGGQLGLWLGVSVLTAAEVVELLLLIFAHLCNRKTRKPKTAIVMPRDVKFGMESQF